MGPTVPPSGSLYPEFMQHRCGLACEKTIEMPCTLQLAQISKMGAPSQDYLDLELLSVELKCLCLASPSRSLHLITPLDQAQEAVLPHLPFAG